MVVGAEKVQMKRTTMCHVPPRWRAAGASVEMALNFTEFVAAQDAVYDVVRRELAAGRKETHWMWFIFPQLAGLGRSHISQKFGLASIAEARSYIEHGTLGRRLRE